MSMSCADLFTTTQTDQGMCCSFNMPAAEEIYVESEYTRIIAELQNLNRSMALCKRFLTFATLSTKLDPPAWS